MSARHDPIIFDEFFEKGLRETESPFLTPSSRHWGEDLELKASLLSATLLAVSFGLQFYDAWIPLSYILLIGVYFLAGMQSLIQSIDDILRLEINIDVMMTLAAFSSVLIGNPMEGALLLVLFSIAESMEEAVTAKAKGAISSLYKLTPTTAWVFNPGGKIVRRSIRDISIDDRILVKAGEIIPLDGTVIDGISSVNLVHLTGESLPITKKVGDIVPAGGQNMEGFLTIKVNCTSNDSTVSRIIGLVTQAQESRPLLQRWFDRFSRAYAMTIIGLTAFFAISFHYIFSIPMLGFEGSVYRAVAFLIAASPCALIIATPIAYLSAVSVCAKRGILVKGGTTFDALASCSSIAFDKTGTLTTGDLKCLSFEALEDEDRQMQKQVVGVAASLEKRAVHPIAQAIVNYAYETETELLPFSEFKSIAGYGVSGKTADGVDIFVGAPDYVYTKVDEKRKAALEKRVLEIKGTGCLIAVVLLGARIFLFRFEDNTRPNMKETIAKLNQSGKWKLLMLTGDHEANAKRIANELGIPEYYANLKPEDKLRYVGQLSKERGLAMVGDGINDAPALARATVGICMGKVGSATAVEAADVVLLHDNLEHLDWLMKKARQTKRIVKQNLTLAGGVILLATTPALMGWVPLWVAVILHEGGTVLVGLNALRLFRK
jgi:Cd2+/Zn2+-exporting ATPase